MEKEEDDDDLVFPPEPDGPRRADPRRGDPHRSDPHRSGPRRGGMPGGGFEMPAVWIRRLAAAGVAVIVLGAMLVFLGRGFGGVGLVDVKDTEVVVVVSYLTGDTAVYTQPGYQIVMPYFQRAYKFHKEPVEFVMKGRDDIDPNHMRQLTVRAKDGSEYWFDDVEIQYRLLESAANLVLHDSGPGEDFKRNWMKSYARSILRDEFGRYSAEEGADPTVSNEATLKAKDHLNALLKPHGIEVIQIITPRPKFAEAYEKAIEDRKLADQQVEKLKVEADQLEKERERRLAAVERQQNTEYERLRGELAGKRLQAEREAIERNRAADAFRIRRLNEGVAERDRAVEEARGLEEQARKDAEGLTLRVAALAEGGDILVREALARRLAAVTFTVVPYRRDPAPVRIEHLGGATVAPAADKGGKP